VSIFEQVMETLRKDNEALRELHRNGQVLWECYWCSGEASITADGSMHSELYDKVICSKCLDKNDHYQIIFHAGLRRDGKPPVFQLDLL